MSTFSIPRELLPDLKRLERMNQDFSAMLPKEFAGPATLLANPLAGAAAFSALGIGLASHAFGMWLGTVSGAAEISRRMLSPIYDEFATDTRSFAQKRGSPEARAKSAAKTLIADVRSTALEIAGKAEPKADSEVAAVIADTVAEVTPAVAEAVQLMPEDFRQPKAMEKPETAEDLKAISGIGPKLETVLHGLGVWTFAQIADWDRQEVAWMDDYLGFRGRIGRDDWIGQAKRLAKH